MVKTCTDKIAPFGVENSASYRMVSPLGRDSWYCRLTNHQRLGGVESQDIVKPCETTFLNTAKAMFPEFKANTFAVFFGLHPAIRAIPPRDSKRHRPSSPPTFDHLPFGLLLQLFLDEPEPKHCRTARSAETQIHHPKKYKKKTKIIHQTSKTLEKSWKIFNPWCFHPMLPRNFWLFPSSVNSCRGVMAAARWMWLSTFMTLGVPIGGSWVNRKHPLIGGISPLIYGLCMD